MRLTSHPDSSGQIGKLFLATSLPILFWSLRMPNPILHQLSVAGSVLTSTLAAWRGTSVLKAASQPAQYLKLYDIEGCPDCRSVRETLTALGLDAQIYPCPKG
ncbi:MAG: hypothetical protein KBF98_08160, partial [Rhodoferax sp.]|nr:hypothetical protein [Rhodoferax sp.]